MTTSSARTGLLAVLLLGPLLLAGCTGSEPPTQPTPITAKEAVERAQDTADEWKEDAELVVLAGFEGGEESATVQRRQSMENRSFPVFTDPLPGDGRAMQWVLVYVAGETSRSMRVTTGGTDWIGQGSQRAGPGATPLGEFQLDSTEAVQAAENDSATFADLVASRDVSLFLTLGSGSAGPEWQLQANSQSLNEQTTLFVNADTGEVLNRTERARPANVVALEGEVNRTAPNTTHALEVDRTRARVAVQLSWNRSAAENGTLLSARLFGDEGEIEPAQAQQGREHFQARWDRVEEGNYTVQIRTETFGNATRADYSGRAHVG